MFLIGYCDIASFYVRMRRFLLTLDLIDLLCLVYSTVHEIINKIDNKLFTEFK